MSPSEDELRAALHAGEGDAPDAAAVIGAAKAAHRQRRARLGAVAGAVVAVAGIGIGSAVAFGGGGGSPAANGSHRPGYTVLPKITHVSVPPSGSVTIAPGPLADAARIPCPATAPHLTPASGQGSGPLIEQPAPSIKACVYTGDGAPLLVDGKQPNAVVSGPAAAELVAGLDAASPVHPAHVCPLYRSADLRVLVLIPVGRGGAPLPPVTARVGLNPCNRTVTNGSAWRYGWTPPAGLTALLHQGALPSPSGSIVITPRSQTSAPQQHGSSTPTSPPVMHGSPVR